MQETFSISQLADEFGLTARAIRFYEDKGLISPRRDGQRRIFSRRERTRLKLIVRGKRLGFSLREIREVLDLYQADPTEVKQIKHLLFKISERRRRLELQRADIDNALAELGELEDRCNRLIKEKKED